MSDSIRYSDRICSAETTFGRIEPLLPEFGITRLARLTGLDCIGIPVWNAVCPNSKSLVINQGKGITDIDAKVSAAMEALERAVACAPHGPARVASCRELLTEGDEALALPGLIASAQPDLGDDEPIRWILGRNLDGGAATWVPLEASLLDRTLENCRYWQSSDGLASGNTETEAVLHGLLERIERDAEVLSRLSPLPARLRGCVAPQSLGDPVLDAMARKIAAADLELRLFDITSDIGIPCFTAVLAGKDILTAKAPLFHHVTVGHGAHPNAPRAAIRAVTEAAQSRLTYISGARDDVYPETFVRPLPEQTRRLFEAVPRETTPVSAFQAEGPDALLSFVLQRLREVGVGPVVSVPLLGNGLPFSVVKVFVPDLENPEGDRKRCFGTRALSWALAVA
ncbi:YcaO-like family protein [Sinorhizobium psoraleae]|uniref:YcaO-like family protein n=1 Tax=Sinorhizobium psoraleae TaxID=520838 RepID=UPI0015681640|nr:YcaO-like family protein [Sinorhizobium psoraleae]